MTGPKNAIIGEESFSELPKTVVPEQDLTAERNAAKFSRTKEFKLLKEHLESRIAFYQGSFPDGRAVNNGRMPTGEEWAVANAIVGELKAIIAAYENAQEVVENARGEV